MTEWKKVLRNSELTCIFGIAWYISIGIRFNISLTNLIPMFFFMENVVFISYEKIIRFGWIIIGLRK